MSLKCYNHPEREATSKCEKCGNVICPECIMVYRETVHRGTLPHYVYSQRYEYCPTCFYDKKIKVYGPRNMMVAIIITIFLIIMIVGLQMIFPNLIILITLILIIVAINIYTFVSCPIKLKELKKKKTEFLNSVKPSPTIREDRIPSKFCPECGTQVEPDVSVCSYCGFIIKE